MSAVEKIKKKAAELNADEQFELFRWWVESDTFRQRQLAVLKRDLASGIEQLDRRQSRTYDDNDVMQLSEDVSRAGRERLKKTRKNPKA